MKSLLILLAIGLLSLGLAACASSSNGTQSTTSSSSSSNTAAAAEAAATRAAERAAVKIPPAPPRTKTDADKDNDIGTSGDDEVNGEVLYSGRKADPTDKRTITALIKRYYAVAAAEDGLRACSMLYSTVAEAVAEDYGVTPNGPAYMKGNTCPKVMTLLFKHEHPQIALELPKLDVFRIRLNGLRGHAVLRFGNLPERELFLQREGHAWRIDALLDSEIS
jgi:hypothetical protein